MFPSLAMIASDQTGSEPRGRTWTKAAHHSFQCFSNSQWPRAAGHKEKHLDVTVNEVLGERVKWSPHPHGTPRRPCHPLVGCRSPVLSSPSGPARAAPPRKLAKLSSVVAAWGGAPQHYSARKPKGGRKGLLEPDKGQREANAEVNNLRLVERCADPHRDMGTPKLQLVRDKGCSDCTGRSGLVRLGICSSGGRRCQRHQEDGKGTTTFCRDSSQSQRPSGLVGLARVDQGSTLDHANRNALYSQYRDRPSRERLDKRG